MTTRTFRLPSAALLLTVLAASSGCGGEEHPIAEVAQSLNNCSASCSQTACSTDCNEADIRDAVAKANACSGVSSFRRTITFNCGAGTVINMQQTSAAAACSGDFERYAVCLTGHHITIDGGNKVTFSYSGSGACAADQCGTTQPALFTVKGNNNTVKNLAMQYFPEGIILRGATSSANTVTGVVSTRVCEDAITVHEGTGHVVTGNTLTGNTTADAGRACYRSDCVTLGPCGTDKAIQINGGTSTISSNVINTFGSAVQVSGGTHTVSGNTITGHATDQNVSQGGVTVSPAVTGNVATATVSNNSITRCKWAVRVVDAGVVSATNNTIKDSYLAAFLVRGVGAGKLKGQGNRMKNNGHFAGSDCQRGALVARDNPSARVDFGGGDHAGNVVVGTSRSSGGNRFCNQGSLNDIWNLTDACTGGSGAGASIGARSNCFDSLPPQVLDTAPITVNTASATQCLPTSSLCSF